MKAPSARRLAVTLHNRKHPFPWGAAVAVLLIFLIGGVFYFEKIGRRSPAEANSEHQKKALYAFTKALKAEAKKQYGEEGVGYQDCVRCSGSGVMKFPVLNRETRIVKDEPAVCVECRGTGLQLSDEEKKKIHKKLQAELDQMVQDARTAPDLPKYASICDSCKGRGTVERNDDSRTGIECRKCLGRGTLD